MDYNFITEFVNQFVEKENSLCTCGSTLRQQTLNYFAFLSVAELSESASYIHIYMQYKFRNYPTNKPLPHRPGRVSLD